MKKIVLLSTLSAALLASFGAHAADTTELKVKGVIRPVACTPSFSGGNVVDYGTIPAKSLTAGAYTKLAEKSVPFSISCDAKTKMALKVADNRASSVITDIEEARYNFGLGNVGTANIGGYTLKFLQSSVTTDGQPANQIFSTDGNKTWTATGVNGTLGKDRTFSWADAGATVPAPFKLVSGSITVFPTLNKPENLPLTQDIPLDGSATLEVVYL